MNVPQGPELIYTLQTAIGPAILISGAGLLLLTLVNRFNHILDRIRILPGQAGPSVKAGFDTTHKSRQLAILWSRAHWIRSAILAVALSALLSACLILILFIVTFLHRDAAGLISVCFIGAIVSLMVSLMLLMVDVQQSLSALRLELGLAEDAPGAAWSSDDGRE
ncbi:MAG: DUF2721 domain-containing protein [Methylococcaceae bacterium]